LLLSYTLDSLHVSAVLANHIRHCRAQRFGENRTRYLHDAYAIVIVEANLPTIADEILEKIKIANVPRVKFMTQVDNKNSSIRRDVPGSMTTGKNKPIMAKLLIDYMKNGHIVFCKDFVVCELELCPFADTQKEVVSHLRNFCLRRKPIKARDGTIIYERHFSGKFNGHDDDFVLAIMIALFNHGVFFSDKRYRAYW
jgi:hypothetical protein